jgi:Zn-dependent protease with chaperone function
VLAVGVPVMMVLDPNELASVLAHEFGHFHGGDTRLGPLVYRTRAAMARTLNAASGWVQGIFKAYASFYLSHSQGISRAQEFAADRLAARVIRLGAHAARTDIAMQAPSAGSGTCSSPASSEQTDGSANQSRSMMVAFASPPPSHIV